jgi:hypothetical protein
VLGSVFKPPKRTTNEILPRMNPPKPLRLMACAVGFRGPLIAGRKGGDQPER